MTDNDGNDEAKKRARAAVLSRRAKFVAAALASVACGKTNSDPHPYACLKVAPIPVEAGSSTAHEHEDAGTNHANAEGDAAVPQAPPMPCLEIARPPPATKDAGRKK